MDISDDSFTRLATATIRQPTYSVFIGQFGDISDKVKNMQFKRRFEDTLHTSSYGRGSIVIHDADGGFMENGRCLIELKDKVKIWAGFAGHIKARFTGIVTSIGINTQTKEIDLGLADYGWLLSKAQTSGDYSDYTTPKLLVNQLLSQVNLPAATFENESGVPSTYTLDTATLNRRSYWAHIQDVIAPILYIYYFDADGQLQCKRRDSESPSTFVFDDANMFSIQHKEMGELINAKSVDHDDYPSWNGWQFADGVRWAQSTQIAKDQWSIDRYGEFHDYEAFETSKSAANAIMIGVEVIDYYSRPRQAFMIGAQANPDLQLLDQPFVKSDVCNIVGWMTISEIEEYMTPGNYRANYTVIAEPGRI